MENISTQILNDQSKANSLALVWELRETEMAWSARAAVSQRTHLISLETVESHLLGAVRPKFLQ